MTAPSETEANYRDPRRERSDIIYSHDLSGHFTWVNKAVERITDTRARRFSARPSGRSFAPEYVEPVRRAIERKLSSEMQLSRGRISRWSCGESPRAGIR